MKRLLFIIAALFITSKAHAIPADANQHVRVTTMSFTAPAITAGNMIIITTRLNGGNVTGISGGAPAWTRVYFSSANRTGDVWCGISTGSATSFNVVLTSAAGAAPEINYSVWSGMGDNCTTEVMARSQGTSATPTVGPIKVLHNNALIIAKTSWGGNRSTVATMNNGFTDLGVGDSGLLGRQGYKILTAPDPALSTSVTISASDVYDFVIIAFTPKEGIEITE